MNDYIKNYLIDVKNLCNQSNLIQKLRKKTQGIGKGYKFRNYPNLVYRITFSFSFVRDPQVQNT